MLNAEQKKTFDDLRRKPTMELIASFYQVTPEIQGIFCDMMAIYEANPTKETAKALSEALSDNTTERKSVQDKKKWIEDAVSSISPTARVAAKKKYIDEQQAVPNDVPASGTLLVALEVVSSAEKNALLDAQAAARLISHVDVMHAFQRKESYQNEDGTFENAFLDKPFMTKIQRLEHLVGAVVNDAYTQGEEYLDEYWQTRQSGEPMLSTENYTIPHVKGMCQSSLFFQKARNEALATLRKTAATLKKNNPEGSEKIMAVVDNLDVSKVESVNEELSERLTKIIEAKKPLTKEDYDNLKKSVKGRPVEGLVEHRTKQILSAEQANLLVAERQGR